MLINLICLIDSKFSFEFLWSVTQKTVVLWPKKRMKWLISMKWLWFYQKNLKREKNQIRKQKNDAKTWNLISWCYQLIWAYANMKWWKLDSSFCGRLTTYILTNIPFYWGRNPQLPSLVTVPRSCSINATTRPAIAPYGPVSNHSQKFFRKVFEHTKSFVYYLYKGWW